jgi:hypothetical protein
MRIDRRNAQKPSVLEHSHKRTTRDGISAIQPAIESAEEREQTCLPTAYFNPRVLWHICNL